MWVQVSVKATAPDPLERELQEVSSAKLSKKVEFGPALMYSQYHQHQVDQITPILYIEIRQWNSTLSGWDGIADTLAVSYFAAELKIQLRL